MASVVRCFKSKTLLGHLGTEDFFVLLQVVLTMFDVQSLTTLHLEGPAALVVILFPLLLVLWLLRNRYKHNLQSLPGPFQSSITVIPGHH